MPSSEQVSGPVAVWVAVPTYTVTQQDGSSTQNSSSIGLLAGGALAGGSNVTITQSNTPLFFGWGETAPEPEFLPEYEPVMNDLRGSRKPLDKLYEGQDARVTATFTVWDELVLSAMMAFTKASNPGEDGGTDIGTLMLAEGRAFHLWMVYPYAVTKSFMVAANMRKGYHFYGAFLDGPIRRSPGTKVNKVLLSWYCGAPIVGGRFLCYDGDMSAVVGKLANLNGAA